MEEKPLKRDENILILSREHHHGLLFAWKLRQGRTKHAEPERMAKYVSYFWDTHLMTHFRDEEDLLFVGVQHPLIDKAIGQHAIIKDLIHRISGDDKNNPKAYESLADLVTDHIRFEERELFPYLEAALSPKQLSRIGDELARLHEAPVPDNYADEFWLNKKPSGDAAH